MHLTDKGLGEAPLPRSHHIRSTSSRHLEHVFVSKAPCPLQVGCICFARSPPYVDYGLTPLYRERLHLLAFCCLPLLLCDGDWYRGLITIRKYSTTKQHLQLSWTFLFRGNSSLSLFIKTRTFSTVFFSYLSSVYVINFFNIILSK